METVKLVQMTKNVQLVCLEKLKIQLLNYAQTVLPIVKPECVLFLVLVIRIHAILVHSCQPLLPVVPVQLIAKNVLIKILVLLVTVDIKSSLVNVNNVMLIVLVVNPMELENVTVENVKPLSSS